MPNRYGSKAFSPAARDIPEVGQLQPRLWFGGDPVNGFYATSTPPEMNYWSVLQAKNTYWAQEQPGTIGTFAANLVPGDERFVTLGAGSLQRSILEGSLLAQDKKPEEVSVWRYLSNRFSPIQDVSEIDKVLAFQDEGFNAVEATKEMFEADPAMARLWEQSGLDPEILTQARNRTHFHYLNRMLAAHAQAVDRIDQYNSQAPIINHWANNLTSFGVNLIAADPITTGLSLGVGTVGEAIGTGGAKVSAGILSLDTAAEGLLNLRPLAAGITRLSQIPAVAHAGLVGKTSAAVAGMIEGSVTGVLWDIQDQHQRMDNWNRLFDRPEWQRSFSWGELGLATTITGVLSWFLTAAGGAITRKAEARQASQIGIPNSSMHDPIARGADNVAAQIHLDEAALRINRVLTETLGDDASDLGWVLNRAILDEHGLHLSDVADFIETARQGMGDAEAPATLRQMVVDLFAQGKTTKTIIDTTVNKTSDIDAQVRRIAMSDSMSIAARELGPEAGSSAVLKRAVELYPEQLKLKDTMMARVRGAVAKPRPKDEEWLINEVQTLTQIAQQRDLMDFEMNYYYSLVKSLKELDVEGFQFAVDITARPNFVQDRIDINRVVPTTEAGQKILKAARDRKLIEELGALEKRTPEQTRELRNARARMLRAQAQVKELTKDEINRSADAKRLDAVREKWLNEPPTTKRDKGEAIDEVFETIDANAQTILEDMTSLSQTMRLLGMGGMVNRVVTGLPMDTGQTATVRSAFNLVRFLASLLETGRTTIESIDATARRIVPGVELKQQELRKFTELALDMDRLVDSGKFGHQASTGFSARIAEFERQISMGLRGKKVTDPDALPFVKKARAYFDEVGEIGTRTGTMSHVAPDFFPNRVNHGVARADERGFWQATAKMFTDEWTTGKHANDLHWDTLVLMGKAKRVIDDEGNNVNKWVGIAELEGLDSTNAKFVSDLYTVGDEKFGLDLAASYKAALKNLKGENGYTALEASAWRAVRHVLHEAEEEVDSKGRVRIRRPAGPLSQYERVFDNRVWDRPELAKYFNTGFFDPMEEYVKGTGFRTRFAATIQEALGIPKIGMDDLIDQAEVRLLRQTVDSKERAAVLRGTNELRRKNHLLTGRSPSLKNDIDTMGEWLGQTVEGGAQVLVGGGFGALSATLELGMIGTFSRIYSPADLVDNIIQVFRGMAPFLHQAQVREELGAFTVGLQRFKTTSTDRYLGGMTESLYRWRSIPKVTAQMKNIWDSVTGKTQHTLGRAGAVPNVLKSLGAVVTQGGALEATTTAARSVQSYSAMRELGRFFPAAERLTEMIAADPGRVRTAYQTAYDAALEAGKTARKAKLLGDKAAGKVFKGMAREAGFGGNWHVAERLSHFKLLEPEMMSILRRAGEATDAIQTKGFRTRFDVHRIKEFAGKGSRQETDLFLDASNRLDNMFESMLRKRINTQSLMNTPTGPVARSWLGRFVNLFSSYARAFVDNVVLDMAHLPIKNAVGLMGMFILGDTINGVIRELMTGKEWSDIEQDMLDDPDNFITRMVFRSPLFGQITPYISGIVNAATKDGRIYPVSDSTAGGRVISDVNQMFQDSVHAISPLSEGNDREKGFSRNSWKFLNRLNPGYNSWWYGLMMAGSEATGLRLRPDSPGYRGNTTYKPKPPVFKAPSATNAQTIPKHLPEEFEFMYKDK